VAGGAALADRSPAEAIDHMARRAIGLLDQDLGIPMREWEG
jgi:4-hydroxy-3-polyprenylbenzoate decarboxylase